MTARSWRSARRREDSARSRPRPGDLGSARATSYGWYWQRVESNVVRQQAGLAPAAAHGLSAGDFAGAHYCAKQIGRAGCTVAGANKDAAFVT